jgi:predicted nucleic acid-binding Zn ribbon protein
LTHRRRSPRPVSLPLGELRERCEPDTLLARVQRRWVEAVGESVAAHAWPMAERAGVLTVACSASVWAQELDLMGPVVVERLNELLGGVSLVRVRCLATGAPE